MQDNKAAHAMLTVALYNGRLNTITIISTTTVPSLFAPGPIHSTERINH